MVVSDGSKEITYAAFTPIFFLCGRGNERIPISMEKLDLVKSCSILPASGNLGPKYTGVSAECLERQKPGNLFYSMSAIQAA